MVVTVRENRVRILFPYCRGQEQHNDYNLSDPPMLQAGRSWTGCRFD
jgi:hypothetical protein